MLETKQLQYFVTAAECDSFSEAAKILYTTQSNISKVIMALEKQLGYSLFQRQAGGIRLNARGKAFYQQVVPLLEKVELLEAEYKTDGMDVVRISTNPGSWFARCFSGFYRLHEDDPIRYNIHTDSTLHIIQRVRNLEDELGFIYIFPEEREQIQYELRRYKIDFTLLGIMQAKLFRPAEYEDSADDGKIIKLIQAERDPFMKYKEWVYEDSGEQMREYSVSVTTNSDHIMYTMMRQNNLCNIGPKSFNGIESGDDPNGLLRSDSREIMYGVLTNKEGEISAPAYAFLEYLKSELELTKQGIIEP